MCVHDIYKNIGTYSVSGRIETGYMNVGNKVSIQPKGEVAVIKSEYSTSKLSTEGCALLEILFYYGN